MGREKDIERSIGLERSAEPAGSGDDRHDEDPDWRIKARVDCNVQVAELVGGEAAKTPPARYASFEGHDPGNHPCGFAPCRFPVDTEFLTRVFSSIRT